MPQNNAQMLSMSKQTIGQCCLTELYMWKIVLQQFLRYCIFIYKKKDILNRFTGFCFKLFFRRAVWTVYNILSNEEEKSLRTTATVRNSYLNKMIKLQRHVYC